MFAINFDLIVENNLENYPNEIKQAYDDIEKTLIKFSFVKIQKNFYTCEKDDMANLFLAITALKKLDWLPKKIKNIRAFKIEQWSDLTDFIKK